MMSDLATAEATAVLGIFRAFFMLIAAECCRRWSWRESGGEDSKYEAQWMMDGRKGRQM